MNKSGSRSQQDKRPLACPPPSSPTTTENLLTNTKPLHSTPHVPRPRYEEGRNTTRNVVYTTAERGSPGARVSRLVVVIADQVCWMSVEWVEVEWGVHQSELRLRWLMLWIMMMWRVSDDVEVIHPLKPNNNIKKNPKTQTKSHATIIRQKRITQYKHKTTFNLTHKLITVPHKK